MLLQCVNNDFCLSTVNSCDFTVHALKKKKKTLSVDAQNAQSKRLLNVWNFFFFFFLTECLFVKVKVIGCGIKK